MKVEVFIERINKTKTLEVSNLKDLLSQLNTLPETVIIVRNNELITEGAKLNTNDKIKLLSVISGG